jgi:hypothetical protein
MVTTHIPRRWQRHIAITARLSLVQLTTSISTTSTACMGTTLPSIRATHADGPAIPTRHLKRRLRTSQTSTARPLRGIATKYTHQAHMVLRVTIIRRTFIHTIRILHTRMKSRSQLPNNMIRTMSSTARSPLLRIAPSFIIR